MELVPSPKLTTVLSESRRLIKSQPRRFLALFFAFVFPLALIATFSPIAAGPGSASSDANPGNDNENQVAPVWIALPFLTIGLVSKTVALIAAISVTTVALRSFHGEPAGLKSVAKSFSASFFPLLATNLLQYVIIFAVIFGFSMLLGCVFFVAVFLGFQIEPNSPHILVLTIAVVAVPSALASVYLTVSWALVTPVVVAESKWGFEALKRSESLVKGKRCLAFVLYLIFAVVYAILGWRSKYYSYSGNNVVALALLFVGEVVVVSSLRTMVELYEIVATTLFYVFCMAVHEKEFSGDNQYARLAVDEKFASGVYNKV